MIKQILQNEYLLMKILTHYNDIEEDSPKNILLYKTLYGLIKISKKEEFILDLLTYQEQILIPIINNDLKLFKKIFNNKNFKVESDFTHLLAYYKRIEMLKITMVSFDDVDDYLYLLKSLTEINFSSVRIYNIIFDSFISYKNTSSKETLLKLWGLKSILRDLLISGTYERKEDLFLINIKILKLFINKYEILQNKYLESV